MVTDAGYGEDVAERIRARKSGDIALEDLVIGATAFHLDFDLATLNVLHFEHLSGATVATL